MVEDGEGRYLKAPKWWFTATKMKFSFCATAAASRLLPSYMLLLPSWKPTPKIEKQHKQLVARLGASRSLYADGQAV
jgi:hypothetical protein